MSYTSLMYHIVFSTKQRKRFLRAEVLPRMCHYLGGIAREEKGTLLAADGWDDHVHLALTVSPMQSISDTVRVLKTNSSKWVHQTYPALGEFAWQDGYGAFSVSKSAMPRVIGYIEGQREHHQKMTFQEEFQALLKGHGIEYNERYRWV
jgi:REP element-mobilizing transposase RayT